ncbi:hemolysin family protein [Tsukamurella sp. 8F]|uniref:hemolysin family protein n=1 Tax=unclassified Tsukamurella TaxID=2633480 RepID=UPI0023B95EE7|nr:MULTISPECIES: hemolysin family protein [unclassified Tsukamurella]MDF0529107.1 hemolysin family protein [Tsukamurella sp. 8J]MDF0588143.1 hemolysin family protein [Tsukamurella sp. 8F]
MTGNLLGVLLTVVLLIANAFFVAAEFALISARKDRLEALYEQGKHRAKSVMEASEKLSLMLAGCQLGITIASLLLGKVGEPAIAHLLEAPLHLAHVPHALLHPISFTVSLALVVVLHILLGEMVPKNIALAGPETAAMLLTPILQAWCRVARPLIALYNWLASLVLRALRIEPKDELDATVSARELSALIEESAGEGLLDEEEQTRLTRALRTSRKTVRDVAIALPQIRGLQTERGPDGTAGPTLGAIEAAVADTGFSRYPVRGAGGAFTGYLHVKDVLPEIMDSAVGPDTVIGAARIRPLPVIDGSMSLDHATAFMRRHGSHLSAVSDEHGRTVGIVALEDLVEEFVGTVRDGTHRV